MLPGLEELLALHEAARYLTVRAGASTLGSLHGGHQSAHRGRGLEFQEVRLYAAGDDARNIDWRVTARRGRPHTKLFREERDRPVWLFADLDPAMFFGSRRQTKSAVVVRATALLAWVAARGGDRVGAVIAGASGPRILPPRAHQEGVVAILGALTEMQPSAPAPPTPQSSKGALQSLAWLVRPGSLILTFSDFAWLDTASEALWSGLAAHSECRLFWVTDALESQGLPNGRFRVGLPNRSAIFDGAGARAVWLQAWREREARLNRLAQTFGTSISRLDTAEPTVDTLRGALRAPKFVA
jgi:uncharacterized protein (DUF58 family)